MRFDLFLTFLLEEVCEFFVESCYIIVVLVSEIFFRNYCSGASYLFKIMMNLANVVFNRVFF